MKKLLVSFLVACVLLSNADARIIGNDPITGKPSTDVVCFGGRVSGNLVGNANEVCIDSEGNIVATTTNNQVIGNPQEAMGAIWIGTGAILGTAAGVYIGTGLSNNANSGTGPLLSLAGRMFTSVRAGTAGPFIVGLGTVARAGSTCGNSHPGSPTLLTGSDFAGIIALGTGASAATNCTLAFGDPYLNTPICSIMLQTSTLLNGAGGQGLNAIVLPTSIQFNTALGFPGKINYICVGNGQ